jgi:hypothetical protein
LLGLEQLELQSESRAAERARSIRLYTTKSLLDVEGPSDGLAVEVGVEVEADVDVVVRFGVVREVVEWASASVLQAICDALPRVTRARCRCRRADGPHRVCNHQGVCRKCRTL